MGRSTGQHGRRCLYYRDSRGRRQRLTFEQYVYLDSAWRQFTQGWGGMKSTLVVRLLRERGLISLDDRGDKWRITGISTLGQTLLDQWRADD